MSRVGVIYWHTKDFFNRISPDLQPARRQKFIMAALYIADCLYAQEKWNLGMTAETMTRSRWWNNDGYPDVHEQDELSWIMTEEDTGDYTLTLMEKRILDCVFQSVRTIGRERFIQFACCNDYLRRFFYTGETLDPARYIMKTGPVVPFLPGLATVASLDEFRARRGQQSAPPPRTPFRPVLVSGPEPG